MWRTSMIDPGLFSKNFFSRWIRPYTVQLVYPDSSVEALRHLQISLLSLLYRWVSLLHSFNRIDSNVAGWLMPSLYPLHTCKMVDVHPLFSQNFHPLLRTKWTQCCMWHDSVQCLQCSVTTSTEPVFFNVYGAQELISRNEYGQPM